MAQFRTKILIIGILCIAVAVSLLTVLILYGTGNLITDPIELVYTVIGAQKVYDGEPLKSTDYILESGELLEGHTAQVKVNGSQTDAGISESTLEVNILDKNGFDVTKKYAVKVNAGFLTVTPQTLTVAIRDAQAIYNGREVEFDKFEILSGSLAAGHRIAAANAFKGLMNVGDRLPDNLTPIVYDAAGNSVTKNYLIALNIGNVRIVPRPVTVKPKDTVKTYDGTPLTATGYEITTGSLAAGQSIKAEITTEAGNEATATNVNGGERIVIKESTFKILGDDGETDVSKNYDITYDTAYLTVEKRSIALLSASDSWVYDGEEHFNDRLDVVAGSIAPGQQIAVTGVTELTEVEAGIDNELSFEITDKNGMPVNIDNYSISLRYGVLKVTPKEITVYTKNYSKVYDGENFGAYIDGLPANETLCEVSPKLDEKFNLTAAMDDELRQKTDAESGTFSLEVRIYRGASPCTDNFSITVISGRYEITKKPVSITLKNINKTYTGDILNFDGGDIANAFDAVEVTGYGLNTTDFTLQPLGVFRNADTYKYTAKYNGDSRNYDFNISTGNFIIDKKAVTLRTGKSDVTMTYNGEFYNPVLTDFYIDGNRGYTLTGAEFNKVFEVKKETGANGYPETHGYQYINALSVKVSADGEDITDNLKINVSEANVTVTLTARTLNVTYSTYIWDGVSDLEYGALSGYANVTVCAGDDVTEKFVQISDTNDSFRLVGLTILNKDGVDVTDLYELDFQAYGTITTVQTP